MHFGWGMCFAQDAMLADEPEGADPLHRNAVEGVGALGSEMMAPGQESRAACSRGAEVQLVGAPDSDGALAPCGPLPMYGWLNKS